MIRKWRSSYPAPEIEEWQKLLNDPGFQEIYTPDDKGLDKGLMLIWADWCADYGYPLMELYWRAWAQDWPFGNDAFEVPEELKHLFTGEK